MKVQLTYFKPNGKYYSSGSFDVRDDCAMYEIFGEVQLRASQRRLPDLVLNHSEFITHVDVPSHPHNHPHLIFSKE